MNQEDRDWIGVFAILIYGVHTLFPFGFLFLESYFPQHDLSFVLPIYIFIGFILVFNVFRIMFRDSGASK